jgi:hypothetical protein
VERSNHSKKGSNLKTHKIRKIKNIKMKIKSILLTAIATLGLTAATMAQVTNKVTCTEKESKNKDGGDPIYTKTCLYKKYKTISKGYPDYEGRYSYEYSVFKRQENGTYVQIKNTMLFNENKNELLSIINSKIEKDYKSYSNDPETKDCFEGACMSVDGTIVSFNLDEIKKYLNE